MMPLLNWSRWLGRQGRPRRFPGGLGPGVKPHPLGLPDPAEPVVPAPLPGTLVLPLLRRTAEPFRPLVTPGETVVRGQVIARGDPDHGPLYAPSSGRVRAVAPEPLLHPPGQRGLCIVLDLDGCHRGDPPLPPLPGATASPQVLGERIGAAGIVGLGGGAFPAALKLAAGRAQSTALLVINGAECDPFLASDAALMIQRAAAVVAGAHYLARALGASKATIAVADDQPRAREALARALAAPNPGPPPCELVAVPGVYPAGGENQLIYTLTGCEVPRGGRPADLGVVCHNVATAAAVADAVDRGWPAVSRWVTIAGAVHRPRVVEALWGTPVAHLVDHCGGLSPGADQLVVGGTLAGVALEDSDVPVTAACNGIAALGPPPRRDPMPCIRCGDCFEVCPVRLLPQQLYHQVRHGAVEQARDQGLFDCIECGCCAAVCPSHIPLVDHYRRAKVEVRRQDQARERAAAAKRRFEARNQRLAQATPPPRPKAKPDAEAIAQAVARAKAQRAARRAARGPQSDED
ncbi:MAG: electron transport complex subunit RsxC [Candidatus Competibacterales bacterium]